MCHQTYANRAAPYISVIRTATRESLAETHVAGSSTNYEKRPVNAGEGWSDLKDAMVEYKALNRMKTQHEKQVMAGFKNNIERDCNNIKASLRGIKDTVANVEINMDHLNAQTEALMNNMINTIED